MDKAKLLKTFKAVAYFLGFPMMSLILFISLMPMFNVGVMGNYAVGWFCITLALWAVVEIVRYVLKKFVGNKSENHQRLVMVVMAVLSIIVVVLPITIFDSAMGKKYEADRKDLATKGVAVQSFDSVMGWHNDFTSKYDSVTYNFINKTYDFNKAYNIHSSKSSWYADATDEDKEAGVGKKFGTFDKVDALLAEKLDAKSKLDVANAELAKIEAAIAEKKAVWDSVEASATATAEEKASAKAVYNKVVADSDKDIVRLKGQRVDISAYKTTLINMVLDIVKNYGTLIPDGLTIDLIGIKVDVGELLNLILPIAGGAITFDMLNNLIPNVIFTGFGPATIKSYETIVGDTYSLAEIQQYDFELEWFPQVLAAGAVKFVSFICVGLVLFSLVLVEYISKKQKELAVKLAENTDGGAL